MRVGVTGHRQYDDLDAVGDAVDVVADTLAARAVAAGTPLEVWSSLAEGADRVVADALVARGAELVAVLPLDPIDYADDFGDPVSRREFERLLGTAGHVLVVGAHLPTRPAAYEAAGLAIVEACPVLVAVCDGAPARGPGGTAAIVDAAHGRGREVIVVPAPRGNVGP